MPIVCRDGIELYWEKCGSGPALVLAAGLGGTGSYWDINLSTLSRHFTVYTFDQRGTGKSSRVPVESVEQMSADLIAILDDARLEQVHYLGHSTGGAIGAATAMDYPGRLRSLMIYASTTCGDDYRRRILGLRTQLLSELGPQAYAAFTTLLLYPPYYINQNHEALAAGERIAATQLGAPHVQASRLEAILAFDRRKDLGSIHIPTLVACANDDILTPRYFSEEYAALIPSARTFWADRGGHAWSRTEPDIFNQVALKFFTEL